MKIYLLVGIAVTACALAVVLSCIYLKIDKALASHGETFLIVVGRTVIYVMWIAAGFFAPIYGGMRLIEKIEPKAGLASIKWTPIQAALMSFSFCLFSKATGEI